jgi:uncharacterized protein (TIGR02677 family)
MSDSTHYNVFAHLTAEKSPTYRAVLGEFARAKSRFVIHLRPSDVENGLRQFRNLDAGIGIELALQQLVEWGNLESHPDNSEVATVEDFWKVRHLYQMSTAGEAAEAALAIFEESIRQPGELQSAALDDIRRHLIRIAELAAGDQIDDVEASNVLSLIRQRFDELTGQAQRFMGGIQRRVDLQSLGIEAFLSYKQRLIDYLERFLRELVMATHEISRCIGLIDRAAILKLIHRGADRELIDRLEVQDQERAANRESWTERWDGLCAWFIGSANRRSQAEELRAAARSAIPALIATVTGINDRRAGHSDRSADYTTLALWFAQTEDDADAHRLWRGAFALHSCRHLSVDQETLGQRELKTIPSTTSWLEAPPLHISPRLHKSGRYTRRGRPAMVIDRTLEKARLAELAKQENEQIQLARQTLCSQGRTRLSELPWLNDSEFQLLLDLLGDALAAKADADATASVPSSDGTLLIDLEPTLDGKAAIIRTSSGELICSDHYVWIRDEIVAAGTRDIPGEVMV